MMTWFVYIERNGEAQAQRFDHWPTVNGKPLEDLQQHELDNRDANLKLNSLVRKYPYEKKPDLT
jgi:hypothetical protein